MKEIYLFIDWLKHARAKENPGTIKRQIRLEIFPVWYWRRVGKSQKNKDPKLFTQYVLWYEALLLGIYR